VCGSCGSSLCTMVARVSQRTRSSMLSCQAATASFHLPRYARLCAVAIGERGPRCVSGALVF
jgi:hypothetical protein